MSERITNDDVMEAFEQAKEAAVALGVKGADHWSLYFGNSTKDGYQCWIASRAGAKKGRNLGGTKRQAQSSLLAMTEAFELVQKVRV